MYFNNKKPNKYINIYLLKEEGKKRKPLCRGDIEAETWITRNSKPCSYQEEERLDHQEETQAKFLKWGWTWDAHEVR